jgi:hypothetical protein
MSGTYRYETVSARALRRNRHKSAAYTPKPNGKPGRLGGAGTYNRQP